jgi:hypothetical protein
MSRTKYLKGPCRHCGGSIEFPVELIGTAADCPHCGKSTELFLARPPQAPTVPRKLILWTAAAALILILGVAGSLIALKRAQRLAERKKQTSSLSATPLAEPGAGASVAPTPSNAPPAETDAAAPANFQISEVRLEKVPGTSLIYAKGQVTNLLDRQRFGVRVELELLDADGQKVGTTKDYTQVIEPKAEWDFKALVVSSNAASAKLLSFKEQQ